MQFMKVDEYGNIQSLVNSSFLVNENDLISQGYVKLTPDMSIPLSFSPDRFYYKNNQFIEYSDQEYLEKKKYKLGHIWAPEIGWIDQRTDDMKYYENNIYRLEHLANSDWTQLPDVSISKKEEWATYRNALRTMTREQLISGEFPEPPEDRPNPLVRPSSSR